MQNSKIAVVLGHNLKITETDKPIVVSVINRKPQTVLAPIYKALPSISIILSDMLSVPILLSASLPPSSKAEVIYQFATAIFKDASCRVCVKNRGSC